MSTPPDSIADVLGNAPLAQQEVRILLGYVLQLSRVQLITQSDRILTADEAQLLATLFARRLAGEPIAYLTGTREFYGLALHVTPDVLIPRPDTELLVELALQYLPPRGRVLDLGTGSGAIAVAIAHNRPDATVTALDVSRQALAIAQRNAQRHATDITFLQSDWFDALTNQRFDLIVANPPYIVAGDRHLSQGDLRFEPLTALTDHGDGLGCLRKIIADAPSYLSPGGRLLMEHGYDQARDVRALLARPAFHAVQSWRDLAGIERVTGGQRH